MISIRPQRLLPIALTTAFALTHFPNVAFAHTGVGPVHDALHGFTHPLTGLDHLLAMFAIGLWAAQRGGLAIWVYPLTFLAIMTLGGALGMAHLSLPYIEPAIAVSVIAIGALVALNVRLPIALSVAIVGVFAFFHGHAHGAEAPATAAALTYAVGFIAATALIHSVGVAVGRMTQQAQMPRLVRCAGAAIALAGICLA